MFKSSMKVLTVTINRTELMNAIRPAVYHEINEKFLALSEVLGTWGGLKTARWFGVGSKPGSREAWTVR